MSPAGAKLMQFFAKHVSHIICPSQSIAATLPNPKRDGLIVIPNGVDPNCYQPSPTRMHGRVAMVARLAPIKGQHVFLEAIREISARNPDTEFIIAGAPLFGQEDYANYLGRRVADLRSDRVRLVGHVDDVPSLLNGID